MLNTNSKIALSPGIPNINSNGTINNTTFMRSGISPTCPRHGRAAQMMIAAATAAAVNRANILNAPNSMNCNNSADRTNILNNLGTPVLVPLIPVSSSSPTTLEEAQV